MITLRLVDDERSIARKVNEVLSKELNRLFRTKKFRIEDEIKRAMPKWLSIQPEIIALSGDSSPGSLSAQLGLVRGTGDDAVGAIINAFVNSVEIKIKDVKKDLTGGIEINFMPSTFSQLLALPEGHTLFEGGDLHWLEWLLMQGYTTIVVGYSYTYGTSGRSGGGFMRSPGSWRVPPQYAGTPENNFITRALDNLAVQKEIEAIIQRNIK